MPKLDLHEFKDDLKATPGPGSKAPPRTIRASDLDENFAKVTLIESAEDPPPYQVEYTKDGTRLKNIRGLPEDAIAKQFDVCENGQAEQYWFVVWENEPDLPE